jgi:hypothetical protein
VRSWLFLLPVALGTVHQAAAQTADVAGVLPGDRWTYEVTDEVTGDVKQTTTVDVLSVADNEIVTRVTARGALRPLQVVYDRNWNRVDDEIWKYRPSDGSGIPAPLQIGKEWRFDSKATHFQSGTAMRITGQSKVVAQEKITTEAGTFDTFKVESSIRQINANDKTKAAKVSATLWYAPSINRWVRKTYKLQVEGRMRSSNTEELADYSRKP